MTASCGSSIRDSRCHMTRKSSCCSSRIAVIRRRTSTSRSWCNRSRCAAAPTATEHSRASPATAPTCVAAAAASAPSQPGADAAGPDRSEASTVSQ
jgi:hypothetical protein